MKKNATDFSMPADIMTFEHNGLSLEQRVAFLHANRTSPGVSKQMDQCLVEHLAMAHRGLREAKGSLAELKGILKKMTATPWFPATCIQTFALAEQDWRAMVLCGAQRRLVGFADGIDPTSVSAGDEVFLNNELNVVAGKSPNNRPRGGETAIFERKTTDGRLVLRHHDEEIVVDSAPSLAPVTLNAGDLVRFDRTAWLAFECIEKSKGSHLFLEDTPPTTFNEVGGLDDQINRVKQSINLHVFHGDAVRKYRLRRKGSVLLVGPSGTGKTLIARALANWLATLSPTGRAKFMNIKPSGLHSMWYGQSEANYREAFRVARAAGENDPGVPVVMFFDEIDAIGMSRGGVSSHVDDRVLTAFMAELDGLNSRGNIIVVGATNRRDALDPALLRPGRLGDLVMEVPRPKMSAARDIFAKHLRPDIPYARNGHGDDAAANREELIASAVSRVFAPNADNELATIHFRDGKRQPVRASDLVSGAIIANIVNSAVEIACAREVESQAGEVGLRLDDIVTAMTDEFETAARALTPRNCRHHLSNLPQDTDIVRIEPVVRKVKYPHRYLNQEAQTR